MHHVARKQIGERRTALAQQRLGRDRREAPILAQRPEPIRRRADRLLEHVRARIVPHVRAVAIDADRHVEVEPDLEFAGVARDRVELFVDDPLQELEVVDTTASPRRPAPNRFARGIAVFGGPLEPAARRGGAREVVGEGFVDRESFEPFAAAFDECGKGCRALRASRDRVDLFERPPFHLRDACVGDCSGFAQLPQGRREGRGADALAQLRRSRRSASIFWDRLDVDVNWIAKIPAARRIGACRFGPRVMQRVQRARSDDACTCGVREPDEVAQIGEIADAPVPPRTQRVKVQRETPGASVLERRWKVGSLHAHPVGSERA